MTNEEIIKVAIANVELEGLEVSLELKKALIKEFITTKGEDATDWAKNYCANLVEKNTIILEARKGRYGNGWYKNRTLVERILHRLRSNRNV